MAYYYLIVPSAVSLSKSSPPISETSPGWLLARVTCLGDESLRLEKIALSDESLAKDVELGKNVRKKASFLRTLGLLLGEKTTRHSRVLCDIRKKSSAFSR